MCVCVRMHMFALCKLNKKKRSLSNVHRSAVLSNVTHVHVCGMRVSSGWKDMCAPRARVCVHVVWSPSIRTVSEGIDSPVRCSHWRTILHWDKSRDKRFDITHAILSSIGTWSRVRIRACLRAREAFRMTIKSADLEMPYLRRTVRTRLWKSILGSSIRRSNKRDEHRAFFPAGLLAI